MKQDIKTLPKWAQRRIANLEARSGVRLMETRALLGEISPLVCEVAGHPWPTTWPKSERLYIAAVSFEFESRLRGTIKRLDEFALI